MPDEDRAGCPEPLSDSAVLVREAIEHRRPDGRPQARDVVAVLERHRHAMERADLAASPERGIRMLGRAP